MTNEKIQIKVGMDKNGKFYVSVPSGEVIPREIYSFLTKDCKAKHDKESNNYFQIEYNPAQGIGKRLNDPKFIMLDVTEMEKSQSEKSAEALPERKESGKAIKVGMDKNGKFYVSVPKGEKVAKDVYDFLTKDCKAKYDKESNNYFQIEYNPTAGLRKRLGTAAAIDDASADKEPEAKAQKEEKENNATNSEDKTLFRVRSEKLGEAHLKAVAKKLELKIEDIPEKLIVVKGTEKTDEAIRHTIKGKYGAVPVKIAKDEWEWVLTNADISNQASIYKELVDLKGIAKTECKSTLDIKSVGDLLKQIETEMPEIKNHTQAIVEALKTKEQTAIQTQR
jgi:hypothetical protein